jgi:transcription elongation factor Elf1
MTRLEIATIGKNTPRRLRAFNPLLRKKVFDCPECGKDKAFIDLEIWDKDTVEDILNGIILCKECYEKQTKDNL